MRAWLLLMGIFCFSGVLCAAGEDPITPFEFKKVLRHHVRNIPELKSLWRQVQANGTSVYLSGGLLRGLMHWINRNLENKSVEEVKAMSTPSVNSLLLQEWSDLDLVAPENLKEWVRLYLPGQHWDVLSTEFMEDSIRAGGATIEKVMVNPNKIVDPFDAIPKYLKGELEFRLPAHSEDLSQGQLRGNTRLALALRYLRFSQNLNEAEITKEGWSDLRSIKNKEWNLMRGGDADYWILKGLRKLYHSTGGDPARFLTLLNEADLLSVLARHHYSLPTEEDFDSGDNARLQRFLKKQVGIWPIHVLLDAAEVAAPKLSDKLEAIRVIEATANVNPAVFPEFNQRRSLLRHIAEKFGQNELHKGQAPVQIPARMVKPQPQWQPVQQQVGQQEFHQQVRLPDGRCVNVAIKIGFGDLPRVFQR